MPRWGALPVEIRRQILACVGEDHGRIPRPLGRGALASVCKEWQEALEPYIFRRLVLRPSRLEEFRRIAWADRGLLRLTYVSAVYYIIDLPTYDCSACNVEEDQSTVGDNEARFTECLWDLLVILGVWTVKRWQTLIDENPKMYGLGKLSELDLHIGAYSPSDCEHKLNDFRFHQDYPFWFDSEIEFQDMYSEYMTKNPVPAARSHWVAKQNPQDTIEEVLAGIGLESRKRILGSRDLEFNFTNAPPYTDFLNELARGRIGICGFQVDPRDGIRLGLPVAQKVTSLNLPRHFPRSIGERALGRLCKESFPKLKRLAYERWTPEYLSFNRDGFLAGFHSLLAKSMPPTLEALSLFEDYNRTFPFNKTAGSGSRDRPLHFDHRLAQAVVDGSKNLRELTACFIFDAMEFFHRFLSRVIDTRPNTMKVEQPWNRLEVLSLTAEVLASMDKGQSDDDEFSMERVRQLLLAAGRAATLMPKLRLMEIWDSCFTLARIFRYSVKDDRSATIRLMSTIYEPVNLFQTYPDILTQWKSAAGTRHVEVEAPGQLMLQGRPYISEHDAGTWIHYIDIVPYLRSRDMVLLPLSRAQVRLEKETDLANENPSTRLIDPLTWDVLNVTPRQAHPSNQGRCWQLCHPPSSRTPMLQHHDVGLLDRNTHVRLNNFRVNGDLRMLHA